MTNGLDRWLKQVTRHLSSGSTLQVRTEIQEHYELVREAALERGATAEAAEQEALTALGDAKAANRQYRRVLLTSAKAGLVREGTWELAQFARTGWQGHCFPAWRWPRCWRPPCGSVAARA